MSSVSSLTRARDALARVRDSRFARDVAVLSGSTATGQAMVVLATPLLTRLYTPSALGLYGVYLAAASVASVGVTLRYEAAIPGADSDDEAIHLLLLALLVTTPMSLLACGALLLLARMRVGGIADLGPFGTLALLPALLGFGATSALRFWLVRRREFRALGRVTMAQGAGRALVPIALGPLSLGWLGLAGGEVAGRGTGVLQMLRVAWAPLRRAWSPGWPARVRAVAHRYRALSWTLLPSTLVDTLAFSLPVPLLTAIYGAAPAGIFLLVQRILSIPASLLGASVADVFHADAARARDAEDPATLRRLVLRTSARLAQAGVLLLLPIALLAPVAAGAVFGGAWRESGFAMAVVSPWALGQLVVSPVSRALIVAHRNGLKLVYDVTALGSLVGSVVGARLAGATFRTALMLMSASQTASFALYFVLIVYAAGRPKRPGG